MAISILFVGGGGVGVDVGVGVGVSVGVAVGVASKIQQKIVGKFVNFNSQNLRMNTQIKHLHKRYK